MCYMISSMTHKPTRNVKNRKNLNKNKHYFKQILSEKKNKNQQLKVHFFNEDNFNF